VHCILTVFDAHRGAYEGLHDAQSKSSDTLASRKYLIVLGNVDLHKLMGPMKMECPHVTHLY
jgi:hypothetical protein